MDRGEHRVRIALGKFNVARHDLDYMRSTTISAGLDRRSQITPTNFDLQHGPKTRPPWRHWSRAAARGAPARDVVSAGALPPDSLAPPSFCPRAVEAARRQVLWKIMAEITCGRKNPCRVAFGQQRRGFLSAHRVARRQRPYPLVHILGSRSACCIATEGIDTATRPKPSAAAVRALNFHRIPR